MPRSAAYIISEGTIMRAGTRMQAAARIAFMALVAAMLFLFFTNDFGLVDIHKTSIVVAVGVDASESGYRVTAQAAVPTPASGEGSASYTQVTGSGATVADAIDDINAKTGFYPKLAFCNLVILGESCAEKQLFTVLDYFYRNDYVPLTALVGMCRGSARELLAQKPSDGGMSSSAIQRAMSEELKNSANASTINLKLLAQDAGSPSRSSYMPVIKYSGGGGGGSTAATPAGTSGSSDGGGTGNTAEFTCLTTAAFDGGRYAGELSEEQSFALNLLRNDIRLAVMNVEHDGKNYTVALKNNSCKTEVGSEGGMPVLKIKFRAIANVQAAETRPAAESSANSHLVPEEVLAAASSAIEQRMRSLAEFCVSNSCDLLGAGSMFYRRFYSDSLALDGRVIDVLKTVYDIRVGSVR